YCKPSTTSSSYWIDGFTINGENNTMISNTGTGLTSGGYVFYDGDTVDLGQAVPYSFTADLETSSSSSEELYIWIDLNHNFTFESSQLLFTGTGQSSYNG